MTPLPSPMSQGSFSWRMLVHNRNHAAILLSQMRSRRAALDCAADRGTVAMTRLPLAPVKLLLAIVYLHLHLFQPRFRIPLLFSADCNESVVDSIPSRSMDDVIFERVTLTHALDDITVCFQKGDVSSVRLNLKECPDRKVDVFIEVSGTNGKK